jgi:O-antigen/teichoic acid export membrane protein
MPAGPIDPVDPALGLPVASDELAAAGQVLIAPVPSAGTAAALRRGIALRGRSMREHAARGTVINALFSIGLAVITLIRGFILARFLSRGDYGIWGILAVALGTLLYLKQIGIGDKYLQQDENDQEVAFQRAFSMELLVTAGFCLLMLAAVPIVALAYGRHDVVAPGLLLVLILPAGALQAPLWIYSRRMNFVRSRLLQIADPVVGFVVAVVLAVNGAGYWALLIGSIAGAWAAAIVAIRWSPYRLRFRLHAASIRNYMTFSVPLFIAGGSTMVMAQAGVIFGYDRLGLAGVGAIALGNTVSQFTNQVDGIVSGTLYPGICAVQERTELLFESFVKSNRLALMWAVPFGVGLALFSSELVHFGIGDQWRPAIPAFIALGLIAAVGHIGFNWDSYFRARAETRPVAVANVVSMLVFLAFGVPLLYLLGLPGFFIGIGLMTVAHVACRAYYLRRLFAGFKVVRHTVRAVAPAIPAAAAVFAARALFGSPHTLLAAFAQLALYAVVTVAATIYFERDLLREVLGYVRRGSSGIDVPPAASLVS